MVPVPVNVPPIAVYAEPGFNTPLMLITLLAAIFAVVVRVDPLETNRFVQEMAVAVVCAPAPLKFTARPPNVRVELVYCDAKAPMIDTSIVPVPVNVPPPTVLVAPGFNTPFTVMVPVAEILAVVDKVEPEAMVILVQLMAVAVDCAPTPLKLTVALVNA